MAKPKEADTLPLQEPEPLATCPHGSALADPCNYCEAEKEPEVWPPLRSDPVSPTTTGWSQTNPCNLLFAALAKAQGSLEGAKKGSVNPHFRSKYADLAACYDACRVALFENDLAVIQMPRLDGDRLHVTTMIAHKSGQWIASTIACVLARQDPQSVGSGVTYMRRYGLPPMVGIAPEDDDGEKAMGRTNGQTYKLKPEDTTVENLKALAAKEGIEYERICKHYATDDYAPKRIEDLTPEQRVDAVGRLLGMQRKP